MRKTNVNDAVGGGCGDCVVMLVMVTAAATAVETRSSWSSALFRGQSIREGGGWQSACMLRLQRHVDASIPTLASSNFLRIPRCSAPTTPEVLCET